MSPQAATPDAAPAGARVEVVAVDRSGITFRCAASATDDVVDVRFDDRRIWSFWLLRDSQPHEGLRRAPWPSQLQRFLRGTTRLSLQRHVTGESVYDAEVQLGGRTDRIAVEDASGRPLGVDKSGRLARTFDTRSAEHVEPLLDAIETVLGALAEAGVEAFPAYGTLLGAVRDGRLIGHDSDADLGYVSRHTVPVDVIRESFRLQRRLEQDGFRTHRYSGAAFKVDVLEGDGSLRGLDVFGGFLTDGRLYLMGEVGAPFEKEWIFPLGTTTLEGRTLPAPAAPDRLLEAMYGAGWRVPDPAFKFTTSPAVVRRLNGWFRGTRVNHNFWARRYSLVGAKLPPPEPTALAAYLVEQEGGAPAHVLDVGAGRGGDSLWLARQGSAVTALDFVPGGARAVAALAGEEGLSLTSRPLNFNETRSWLVEGARQARSAQPRAVLARHVADALTPRARQALWRFSEMVLREGGRLYVEFLCTTPDQPAVATEDEMMPLDLDVVVADLRARGAVIVEAGQRLEDPPLPLSRTKVPRPVGRVVAHWGGNA